jgi:hypothetical protein
VVFAVVVTASSGVSAAVEQCAAAGVRGVAVLSGMERTDQHRSNFERHVCEQIRAAASPLSVCRAPLATD